MSFGGRSKRDFDYESALADYTSANDSPYGGGSGHPPSRQNKKRSIQSSFPQEKLGFYQQHVEILNQQFKDLVQQQQQSLSMEDTQDKEVMIVVL
jgi:hypothetical protein